MSRRLVISGVAAAAVLGAVIPAFAQSLPVTITHDTSNGVGVGVFVNGSPGAGAHVSPSGQICAGIGEGVPFCTPDVIGGVEETIPQQEGPVTIDTSNGVGVGVSLKGQPVVDAHVGPDGQACVGVSLEVPFCTPGGGIGTRTHSRTQQSLPIPPVTLRHDENGTAVGVGDVGVVVSPSGRICPVVSTQAWQCVGGN